MKSIIKYLCRIVAIICILNIHIAVFADTETTQISQSIQLEQTDSETVDESLQTKIIRDIFVSKVSSDATKFQTGLTSDLEQTNFVPIEAKLALMFMKAVSAIDPILQMSLVRFVIIFLLIAFTFWVGIEGYNLAVTTGDYKKTIYNIIKQGLIISVWIIVLHYGPAKIFNMIITPIVNLGAILSDLILNAVAHTYKTDLPNTCSAIRDYVASNADGLIIDAQSAANIMCLPARVSVFFYKAIVVGWRWFVYGFGNSVVSVFVGAVAIVLFFKCMFKFAFMTIGVVADLFFTLLLLPFTALAEATPKAALSGMVGDIFNGFLKIFNTKKLSDQILVFINATIYFVTLSIIIAICAILLSSVTNIQDTRAGDVDAASVLLGGALVFYLADQSDKLAQKIGGKIENTFGEQTEKDAKNLWAKLKTNTTKILKTWAKK